MVKSKGTVARTPLDCAKDVPAMARFAMARSVIAVVRFMTVSPFSEASKSDRLQFVKGMPPALKPKWEPTIMSADDGQVTLLLKAMKNGDESAAGKLLPLVYDELHRLAKSYMQRERKDHTLQPTALINEAYLRLARDTVDWQSRQHFIGVAANVMRRLLVDHAGAHNAEMSAGVLQRVELEDHFVVSGERSGEVLALHEALTNL